MSKKTLVRDDIKDVILTQAYRPQVFDGRRRGVTGIIFGLAAISRQLDYLIWMKEEEQNDRRRRQET